MANISITSVKKHIGLLSLQAMILVLLALVYVGVEFNTQMQEASLPHTFTSPLVDSSDAEKVTVESETAVLGTHSEEPSGSETSVVQETPTEIMPTPYPRPLHDTYTLAIFGDSMVDTMGERLEYLEHELTARYPNVTFHLYNYGVGSQNVHDGLERWNKPLKYVDRDFRAITELKPDIIILGSFAYNPLYPYDRNAEWLGYTELVQRAQKITPNVYMLAEIAPIRRGFGFGPNGVNWEPATAFSHTQKIIEGLQNVLGLSRTLNVPLIDVYTPSLQDGAEEGRRELVNPSDNIHPSVEGHLFIAKIIADTVELK